MSFKRFEIDGYGQLELNNAAFRRDGRIEAQCFLDPECFAEKDSEGAYVKASVPCENGMVLAVDKVNKIVRFVKANETMPLAINYSTEHFYDERANALKDYKIEWRKDGEYFLPRMGYLDLADLFTTNCFGYDDSEFDDDEALMDAAEAVATTPLFAMPSNNGAWKISATKANSGLVAQVVKAFTMPDGTDALQLQVIAL